VEQGIDSISVEPDAILKITLRVAEVEERLAKAKKAAPVSR
jgi:pyruvate,water dikinase